MFHFRVLRSTLVLVTLTLCACTERNPGYIADTDGGAGGADSGLSCENECVVGKTTCLGDQIQLCQLLEGCARWSEPQACPPDEPFCSEGACSAACEDECEAETRRCSDLGFQRCGQSDSDPCLDWEPAISCDAGEHCEDGVCVLNSCEASCEGKACGADDGCGYPCEVGSCPTHASCVQAKCVCDAVVCGSACCALGQICSAEGACVVSDVCEHKFVRGASAVNDLVTQGWIPIAFAADSGGGSYGAWLEGGGEYRYISTNVAVNISSVVLSGGTLEAFYNFDRNMPWHGVLMVKAGGYQFFRGESAVNAAVAKGFEAISFHAWASSPGYSAWLWGGDEYRYVDADYLSGTIAATVSAGGALEAFYKFDGNGSWSGALVERAGQYQFAYAEAGVNKAVADGWHPLVFLADASYPTKAAWLEGAGSFRYVTSNVEPMISTVVGSGGKLHAFYNFDGNGAWHGALMRRGCLP
ncbi:MAG: hypothetical protein JRH20_03185 [Deltaproteobacteria bacterium]|nr:hypothetical protein [Deltaproteobacteria bacterium]